MRSRLKLAEYKQELLLSELIETCESVPARLRFAEEFFSSPAGQTAKHIDSLNGFEP
jgi:hypothetical protein